MAPYLNFLVPLGFSVLGLWIFMTWPGTIGFIAFIGLFVLGSCLGAYLFKRYATLDQIKADLEDRVRNP